MVIMLIIRGCCTVGSALVLHIRGHEFDPHRLHKLNKIDINKMKRKEIIETKNQRCLRLKGLSSNDLNLESKEKVIKKITDLISVKGKVNLKLALHCRESGYARSLNRYTRLSRFALRYQALRGKLPTVTK
jgi:ribosomal protein S14